MWAAKSGHAQIVEFLVKSGADVDKHGGWVSYEVKVENTK